MKYQNHAAHKSAQNLDELSKRRVRSFVPNFHEDVGDNIDPEIYKYDAKNDLFTCPMGKQLERKSSSWAAESSDPGLMIGIVQNIKRMMGNGPVVEVGLHMAATAVALIDRSDLRGKLEILFRFFAVPVLP